MTFGKDFTQAVEQKQIAQQGTLSFSLLPTLVSLHQILNIIRLLKLFRG